MSPGNNQPDNNQDELIDQLAESFAERYRRGERPSLGEYIKRHPQLADEIRELFPAMVMMERAELDLNHAGLKEEIASAEITPTIDQLGDFHIIREIGRGGMGIVYEAEQTSLGRRVALKVLPEHRLLDSNQKKRFEREAKAAAQLHHTNIVPVFGVGEHEGLHYYAMQYIQGLGLDEVLKELRKMPSRAGATAGNQKLSTEQQVADRKTVVPDVSAVSVAQSLMSGRFQPTVVIDLSGSKGGASFSSEMTDSPPASVRPATDAPSATRDTATARLSKTFSFSKSVALPGQSKGVSNSKPAKATYWQSIARIGVQGAEALGHAHEQGILHRDIKPSNLLLDTHGTIWVTDFGLAKTQGHENLTGTGDIVGTLRYMAPEMFNGKSDARSDLYALGLTLYELLILKPAFDETDRHKLIRQVTSHSPQRLRKVDAHIPKDLETIVHKAIERDPAHRYQSAEELAVDLRHFVADEPIQARRISAPARFGRWCKRNPALAVATNAVVLLLITVTLVSIVAYQQTSASLLQSEKSAEHAKDAADRERKAADEAKRQKRLAQIKADEADRERKRAEENLRKAREVVDRLFVRAAEDLDGKPGMVEFRRELLEDALEFYQGFLKQKSDDPEIRLETAQSYLRVANIHGILGDVSKKTDASINRNKLLLKLQHDFPQEPKYRAELAASHSQLGAVLLGMNQIEEGKRQREKALEIWTGLANEFPEDPQYRWQIVHWFVAEGTSYKVKTRQYKQAERWHLRGLKELDKFAAEFPEYPREKIDRLRMNVFSRLGTAYLGMGYRNEQSAQMFRKSLAIEEKLARSRGRKPPHNRLLTNYLARLALRQNKPREAERLIRKNVAIDEYNYSRFPDHIRHRHTIQGSLSILCNALSLMNRFKEAEEVARRKQEIAKRWFAKRPKNISLRLDIAWTAYELGHVLFIQGKHQQAADAYRPAMKIFEELATEFPDVARHQNHCAYVLSTCPAQQFQNPPKAIAIAKRALQLAPNNADFWSVLARAQYAAGEFKQTIESLQKSKSLADDKLSSESQAILAMALWQSGDKQQGRKIYDQMVRAQTNKPNGYSYVIENRLFRVEAQKLMGIDPDRFEENKHGSLLLMFHALGRLARSTRQSGNFQKAISLQREAGSSIRKLLATEPDNENYKELERNNWEELARYLGDYANQLLENKDDKQAEKLLRESMDILREKLGKNDERMVDALQRLASKLQAQGRHADAEKFYRQSLEIYKHLVDKSPDNRKYRIARGHVHLQFGVMLRDTKRNDEAEMAFLEALAVFKQLSLDFPDHHPSRWQWGVIHWQLGLLMEAAGRHAEAEKHWRGGLDFCAKALEAFPGNEGFQRRRTQIHDALSESLSRQGKHTEAEKLLKDRLEHLREKFGKNDARVAGALRSLASKLQTQGRHADAEKFFRQTLAVYKQLSDKSPGNRDHRIARGHVYWQLGVMLRDTKRNDEAEKTLLEALAIFKQLTADFPDHHYCRWEWGFSHWQLGWTMDAAGRHAESEKHWRGGLDVYAKGVELFPGHEGFQERLARSYDLLARNLIQQGKQPEAAKLLRDKLEHLHKLQGEGDPRVAEAKNHLTSLVGEQNKHTEKEKLLREKLKRLRKRHGDRHYSVARCLRNLAKTLADAGNSNEAHKLFDQSIGVWRNVLQSTAQTPKGKLVFLGLKPYANQPLTNERSLAGNRRKNDLAEVPRGEHSFAGVKFRVGENHIQLGSKALPKTPTSVKGIIVRQPVAKLHFLHSAQLGGGTHQLGKYRVIFADGSTETIPIVGGTDVRDWWNLPPGDPKQSHIAWVGANGASRPVFRFIHLSLTTWQNPHPGREVKSIDYVSANTQAAPFCVAITVEQPTTLTKPKAGDRSHDSKTKDQKSTAVKAAKPQR